MRNRGFVGRCLYPSGIFCDKRGCAKFVAYFCSFQYSFVCLLYFEKHIYKKNVAKSIKTHWFQFDFWILQALNWQYLECWTLGVDSGCPLCWIQTPASAELYSSGWSWWSLLSLTGWQHVPHCWHASLSQHLIALPSPLITKSYSLCLRFSSWYNVLSYSPFVMTQIKSKQVMNVKSTIY